VSDAEMLQRTTTVLPGTRSFRSRKIVNAFWTVFSGSAWWNLATNGVTAKGSASESATAQLSQTWKIGE